MIASKQTNANLDVTSEEEPQDQGIDFGAKAFGEFVDTISLSLLDSGAIASRVERWADSLKERFEKLDQTSKEAASVLDRFRDECSKADIPEEGDKGIKA